jgi:hypothetical protein
MTEKQQKDFGPVDSARERTGLYGFGFQFASFVGFMVPVAVAAIAVLIAWYVSTL